MNYKTQLKNIKERYSYVLSIAVVILLFAILLLAFNRASDEALDTGVNIDSSIEVPSILSNSGLNVDFSQSSIDLEQILSGGPGKDGIPAISNPKFVQIQDSKVSGETQVIVVENNGEQKIYPYSILVWHEIVNDIVGGMPLAITFCPLCGSAIVFDRELEGGEIVEFGVSGFLFESNLLMYNREDSESLWSQSRGEAVAGARNGEQLEHFPLQLLTYSEAKELYSNATVLSDDTGYSRDYSGNPYSGYEDTDQTYFPISVDDSRFPAKEVFYIVPLEGMSIAVRTDKENGTYGVPDSDVRISFNNGQIRANWGDAELPGYYEMWFSWATHNQDGGIVLE